jgi:hypothetical protein
VSAGEVLVTRPLSDGRTAMAVATDRDAGDLEVDGQTAALARRRAAVTSHPWTWLRQVHGADVITVTAPGEQGGTSADAAVTAVTGAALAVHTADCAPVVLVAESGAIGVAHAGWRGLASGVVAATVDAVAELAGGAVSAVVGPCIHAECYEFGQDDLDVVVAAVGPEARGVTAGGGPALDLPAAVGAALARAGVVDVAVDARCTSCDEGRYSHRARGDRGRQALVAWIDP